MPQGSETQGGEREERRPLTTDDLAQARADLETDAGPAGQYDTDRPTPTDTDMFGGGDRYQSVRTTDQENLAASAPGADLPTGVPRAEGSDEPSPPPLLPSGETDKFRLHWTEIQAVFVDDPQEAVRAADQLIAEVMQSVATSFGQHKHQLEGQWQRGEDVSTEDLRQALRQYRSFFSRLLST